MNLKNNHPPKKLYWILVKPRTSQIIRQSQGYEGVDDSLPGERFIGHIRGLGTNIYI
jgi:hypothetical protein